MPICCPRCQRPCHSAEERLALDKSWHIECFTCAICNRALDSVSLYECRITRELYCRQCYKRFCSSPGYGYGAALISDLPIDHCSLHDENRNDQCFRKDSTPPKNIQCNHIQHQWKFTLPPMEGEQCNCCPLVTSQVQKLSTNQVMGSGDYHFDSGNRKPMKGSFTKKSQIPPPPPPLSGFWKNSSLLQCKSARENTKWNFSGNKYKAENHCRTSTITNSNSVITGKVNQNINHTITDSEETSWLTDSVDGESWRKVEIEEKSQVHAKEYKDTKENAKKFGDNDKIDIANESIQEITVSTENHNISKFVEKWKSHKDRKSHQQTIGEISDGLMAVNYSEPVQKQQQEEDTVDELQEKPKSFWDRLSIFSSKEKNPKPVEKETHESASSDEEVSFAMAVEDKRLQNIKKGGKQSLTSKELESISREYDEIEINQSKALSEEVKTSKSELNSSFEHMKTISQSQINLGPLKGQITSPNRIFCKGCLKEILESDSDLVTLSEEMKWHSKCFKCSKCQVILNERNFFFKGKWLYCMTHYAEAIHAPKCEACNQYILEPTYTMAKGKTWHKDHFRCTNCKIPIIESKFVILAREQIVCFTCYEQYFTKICQTCHLKIKPTEQFVFHKDFYWHAKKECLHCHTCGQDLVGRQTVFFKDAIPYCSKYCAVRRTSVDN